MGIAIISTIVRALINIYLFKTFGFLNMCFALVGLRHLEYYVMYYVFGKIELNPVDQVLLFENETNRLNVMSCFISEKFKTDELIPRMMAKAYQHPRTRSKLTNIMGNYYWDLMSEEELKSKELTFITKIDGIHNE